MSHFKSSLLAAAAFVTLGLAQQASASTINVNALGPFASPSYGTPLTVSLAAGTYQITYGYTGAAGQYQAWNYALQNIGTPQQAPSPNGWTDAFSFVVNGNAGDANSVNFNGSTVYTGTPVNAGASYASAADAFAHYSAALPYLTFALAAASNVTFYVPDYGPSSDNTGGVTLNLTAVPEPASMALLGAGLLGIGMIHRRRSDVSAG